MNAERQNPEKLKEAIKIFCYKNESLELCFTYKQILLLVSVLNIFLKVMKHPREWSWMWRDLCGKEDLKTFFSSSQSSPTSYFKGAGHNFSLRAACSPHPQPPPPSSVGLVSIPWFFWKCPLSICYPRVTPRWEWWLWPPLDVGCCWESRGYFESWNLDSATCLD